MEDLDWINVNQANRATPPRSREPVKIDPKVSEAAGVQVLVNDPRLMRLVAKWKRSKKDMDAQDNFLEDAAKVQELRKVFNPDD